MRSLVRHALRFMFGESGVDGSRWTWDVRGLDPATGAARLAMRVVGNGAEARVVGGVDEAAGGKRAAAAEAPADEELQRALAALALVDAYDGKPCRVWVGARGARDAPGAGS